MNCFNCGKKIALYMEGTDDIENKPHCGACREYERKIAELKAVCERRYASIHGKISMINALKEQVAHLNDYRSMKLHVDKYFEENKPAMDMFIKWLRQNPYPEIKEDSNGN